jgi:flagellar basal-body rod protein FlgF
MSQQIGYVALTGLNATMNQISALANNLANANTVGYKAQRPVFQAQPLFGQGLATRVDVEARQDTADFRAGPIMQTGRQLDIAVAGDGWIGVQASDGTPALTRNGSLTITPTGMLQTSDGRPVLGNGGGPISLPPLQNVTIGQDGTISGVLAGQTPDQVTTLNRILLANPDKKTLSRRSDGLFSDNTNLPPTPDAKVQLQVGALEQSNTDSVALMLSLIEDTRMFQMQTELVHMTLNAGQGQGTTLSLT